MGFRTLGGSQADAKTKIQNKNLNLEIAEISKYATRTHLLSWSQNSGLLSIVSESESELLVYNARNLELMGFTDSRFDAIGIASKLSYMDFGDTVNYQGFARLGKHCGICSPQFTIVRSHSEAQASYYTFIS